MPRNEVHLYPWRSTVSLPTRCQNSEVQMNLFKTVKESVTVKQAAALYGLPVTTTWMVRCPFHEDHTPSMKLNDTYYYCFGCGATGMSSTSPPSCLASAASRQPGSCPRTSDSVRTSPHPVQLLCPSQPLPFRIPARGYCLLSPGPTRLPRPVDSVANRVCSPLPRGTAGRAFCRGSAHDVRCGRPH